MGDEEYEPHAFEESYEGSEHCYVCRGRMVIELHHEAAREQVAKAFEMQAAFMRAGLAL